MLNALKIVQNNIGYIFKNKNLLNLGLCHPSSNKTTSSQYQRLEFLGDKISYKFYYNSRTFE